MTLRALPARLVFVLGFTLLCADAGAQTNRTWDGGGDGFSWNDPLNWNADDVPNTGTEKATIGSTSVNRNIITPSSSTSIQQMDWQQSTNAVNQITLGNDLTVSTFGFTHNNSTSSAANMLVDLKGFTFTTSSDAGTQPLNNVTVTSSIAGGQLRPRNINIGATSVIGSGVAVRPLIASSVILNGTWDVASTLRLDIAGTHTILGSPTQIGSIQVGDASNNATMSINPGVPLSAQRDVNVAVGSNINFVAGVIQLLAVKGNFTDPNTAGNYGSPTNSTVAFYGSPFPQSVVSIARTGLSNAFRVGDNGSDFGGTATASNGNIRLANDLATTGAFTVRGGSRINLVDYTVTSGNFTADSGSIYGYSVGTDAGLIQVNGNLTLNNFVLDMVSTGGWVNGSDLNLFTYTGTLTGTPSVTLGQVPGVFSYSALVAGGGVVKLTNLVLPEPTGMVVLTGATMLLLSRRRRQAHA